MTTPLDKTIPATVLRLISTYGLTGNIVNKTAQSFAAASLGVDLTETNQSCTLTPLAPVAEEFYLDTVREGTVFETWLAGSGLAFVPSVGDEVELSGFRGTLVGVDAFYSGTLLAAYRLRVQQ